jgi:hypothetical protein
MVEDFSFITTLVLLVAAVVSGALLGTVWHNMSHWRR